MAGEIDMDDGTQRFVALDLHKDYVMVAALDAQKRVVLSPRRVRLDQFAGWAARHLQPPDQVVLEATTNAWYIYDLLQPLVARVVVADPAKAKAKMALPVKTDKRDTLGLAELLVTESVPAVWVPPVPVRDLRSLLAHRQRLVHQRTATKNRLRNLLLRHHLVPPVGSCSQHTSGHGGTARNSRRSNACEFNRISQPSVTLTSCCRRSTGR